MQNCLSLILKLQSIANGLIGGTGPLAPNPVMEGSGSGTGRYPKRLFMEEAPASLQQLQILVGATTVPVLQVVIRKYYTINVSFCTLFSR